MSAPTNPPATPETWPLTEAQNGLWYAQRLDPGNPIFNTGHVIEIDGALDLPAFARAADQALAEADVLTLRLSDDAERGPLQRFDPALRPRLQIADLQAERDPRGAALAAIATEQNTPVDPTRDTLAAFRLFVLGPGRHLWYQRVHHLLADGYGMLLIENRVAELYAAAVSGQACAPGATGTPFASYAEVLAEDAAYQASGKRAADRDWWRQAFTPMPAVPGLAEGNPVSAHTWLRCEAELPQGLVDRLKSRADAADMVWPDLLTVLTAAYLARHTGSAANVVGVPYMGRLGSVGARVPCMAMNVLPVAIEVDQDAPLQASLDRVARQLRQARRHGRYRSEQLRRDLGLLGGQRRLYGPLINVLPFDAPMALPGLATRRQVLSTGPVEDLTITFRANAATGALLLTLDANPLLYEQAAIDAHRARLGRFLDAAVDAATLSGVPTLTPAERQHWLYGVNASAHPVEATTLTALLEHRFARTPDAVALDDGRRQLSYARLDALSAALARRLQHAGVRRGDIVAVMLPRSVELVLALVATLRCGAAYLPLDASHPPERLAAIAASARPRVALVQEAWRARLPAGLPALDASAALPAEDAAGGDATPLPPREAPGPFDAAYVIYTSGSTGTPKGVVVEHDAIVNRLQWMAAHYGIGADERILQKTPATFDVSVWEFFLPLLQGATLVLAPPEAHKDPAWLAAILRQQRITTLHFVPSMLAAFLAEPAAAGIALRRVFCSGEALPAALRDRFHETVDAELHNLYGPTEAAVDVSWWNACRGDRSLPVPIGHPVWNTALYVLDDQLQPVPPGVTGHLYIAGRQLARGYLGRPDLTEARFLPNPFTAGAPQPPSSCHGARMYATGDLARWRPDGALVFLGRSDHQVKIRGLRIELDEIESVLASAPGVAKLAIIAREDRPGDQHIVAYVVRAPGVPAGAAADVADTQALRALAGLRLPDYMVPSAFVFLPDLPVTRNGKLDRAALPAPALATTASRAPASARERAMAQLFAQVLGLGQPIGADDDFFELGGHSLLAARLMAALRQSTGLALGLGTLFERPTVARLAAYLDELDGERRDTAAIGHEGFGPVIALQHPAEAPARERRALFCIHPAGGISWCYGALGRALDPARPAYGIQARALDLHASAPATLEEMARQYVDTLIALQPEGPYHLAGWSVGGIIAQAMAVELRARDQPVGTLALLDAYPADVWRDSPEPEENAALKALLLIAGYDPGELRDVPLERAAVIGFLRASGHPLGELGDAALQGVIRVVENNNRLVRGHRHQRYDGDALFFRAALDHAGTDLAPAMWKPYVRSVEVTDIPALHAHLTGAHAVAAIAPVLNRSLG